MLYLDIFFIIVLVIWTYWVIELIRAYRSDAPFVPITKKVLRRMVEMVEVKDGDLWIDLGSGDGRLLIAAARRFPIQGLGIERLGLLRLLSRIRILQAGLNGRIRIKKGNFFHEDLSRANIISMYLLTTTNERLCEKLKKELAPGAKVISHRFALPGLRIVKEDAEYKLYVAEV